MSHDCSLYNRGSLTRRIPLLITYVRDLSRVVYPSCKGSRKETSYFTSLLVPQIKLNLYSKKNGETII